MDSTLLPDVGYPCRIVLFLNPWSDDILMRHFTSPRMDWRMFYLLPFPLAAALVGVPLHTRIGKRFGLYLSWVGLGTFAACSFLSLCARDLIGFPLASVVLHRRAFDSRTRAVTLLKDKGFCEVHLTGNYKLFVQDDTCNLSWKGPHGGETFRETLPTSATGLAAEKTRPALPEYDVAYEGAREYLSG